jgi:hypothetical protein
MTQRLRAEIHNKSLEVKKKIKELNNILSDLYNKQRSKQGSNLYEIKRTAEKVNSAAKHLSRVDTKQSTKLNEREDKEAREDIAKLHKSTLTNILVLEEFYKDKLRKENKEGTSDDVEQLKKNLDSVKLAYNDLKRLDLKMNLRSKEWRELE